jgi:choline dehydrogenase-like flavoprotein
VDNGSHYDLVVVGTGFASSFFLHRFLQKNKSARRILVLERGDLHTHAWQIENNRSSSLPAEQTFTRRGIENKEWFFTIGFGGSSNCWTGCTPRMLPNDFRLKSTYGVGYDWPVTYDELEPFYAEVEALMSISGPDDWTLSYRSMDFPQPPHNLSAPDKILRAAYPGLYYPQATARARIATQNRSACCASAQCSICPVNAKFTILNEMKHVYADKRVELQVNAEVESLSLGSDTASSANVRQNGALYHLSADLFVLGANGIFNPAILKKSGDTHDLVGRRLHEQMATAVTMDLNGLDNFQGSTFIPGQGYMFYDGGHRKKHGACMTESLNMLSLLRPDLGRWRQRMGMVFIVEDIPLDENRVDIDAHGKPVVTYEKYSDYGLAGLAKVPSYIEQLGKYLPIERVYYADTFKRQLPRSSEAHIQGTVVMGRDPATSVIDERLIHHRYRNLLVLGSSAFPTGAPANPTITLSALSLMAAEKIS